MNEQWVTGDIARWEVIWWSKKGKRFIVKEFENDLASAQELYLRVKQLGAPFATLRCTNVGWPPPERYRPYIKKMVKRVKTSRGRTKRTIVEVEIVPMSEVNLKGAWWCPYCCQMRRFRKLQGMVYRYQNQEYWLEGVVYACPVCEITHVNHHVRKWNPHAQKMAFRPIKQTRIRRTRGSRRHARRGK